MTQFEITVDENLLPALFGQGDGLKVLMEQVLNQVLAAQVTNALQAQPGERTAERTGYRNGFRERRLQTRIGTLTLSVPRTRSGEFSPELWEMKKGIDTCSGLRSATGRASRVGGNSSCL